MSLTEEHVLLAETQLLELQPSFRSHGASAEVVKDVVERCRAESPWAEAFTTANR